MATAVDKIEFIPDEPTIEFIPDDVAPTPAAVEFIPDEPTVSPELIAQEAQRASGAALQAVDMMSIPRQFDWSDVNERMDAERFREAESLRAHYSGKLVTPETRAMRARELELRSQITPFTEAGRYLSRMGAQAIRDEASARATEEAMRTPSDILNSVLGPGLQSSIGPVAESFSQNALPALGGVLSAAAYSTPQTGLAGMGIQMIASGMGTMTAAQGQEALLRSAETPEETTSRQQRAAQAEAEFPVSRFVGGALASAPYFRPSMDNIGKAVYGNRAALTNIGVNAAIGGAADAALAKLEGREIDPRSVGISALANVFLSEPTRLGRSLGFQPTTPAEIAEYSIYGPREIEPIPIGDDLSTAGEVDPSNVFANVAQRQRFAEAAIPEGLESGLTTRGTTSTADVFANVPQRTSLAELSSDIPILPESFVDSPSTTPTAFSNDPRALPDAVSIDDFVNRQIDPAMMASVRSSIHDDEIFKSVIESIPVDVMDKLVGQKFSSESILNQKAMLADALSVNPSQSVIPAVVRVVNATLPLLKDRKMGIFTPAAAIDGPSGGIPIENAGAESARVLHSQQYADPSQPLQAVKGGTGVPEGGQGEVVAEVAPSETQPATVTPGDPTSIKNAQTDLERVMLGMDPAESAGRRPWTDVLKEATDLIREKPDTPDILIAELSERPRPLDDTEDFILLSRQTELLNARNAAEQAVNSAAESGDDFARAAASTRLETINKDLAKLYDIDRAVGTQNARGLAARKAMLNRDFSLAQLEARAMAAKNGEPLTPQEQESVVKIADDYQNAQSEADAIEAESVQAVKTQAVDDLIRENAADSDDPVVKTISERIIAKLDERAANAAKRLRDRFKSTNVAVDPLILADVIEIAAAKTAKGAVKFAQWSADMIREFGENVRPYLQPAWDQREAYLDKEVSAGVDKNNAPKVGARVKKAASVANQQERIESAIDRRIAENGDIGPYVQRLAKEFVRGGVKDREQLVDAVFGVLQPKVNGLTRERTMDMISGYGSMKQLSKEPVDITLRDLKGQMQQVAKLRDIASGVAPRKTGVERRVPSAEERRLTKQVNEAKRKYGVKVTDPATQLKSTQDAVRTSLRNSIEDMTLEIETGQKPAEKTPAQYTEDIKILRSLRDRVRQTLDFINGPRKPTEQQQIAAERAALEQSIAGYTRLLTGDTVTKKQPRRFKENEALRAKREALRAQLDELNAADATLQENRKAEALVRQIEAAERALTSNAQANPKMQGPETQLVVEARTQLERLRDQLSAKRANDPARQREAIDRAEAAAEKAIAKLDSELRAGDIAVKRKSSSVTSERLEYLRAQRAAMVDLRKQLRDEAKPRLDVEELAIRRRITQLLNNDARIRERIAAEDFAPRARKDPADFSNRPDYLDALAKRDEAHREFNSLQEKWKRQQEPPFVRYVLRGIQESWRAFRNLNLTADLSAMLQVAPAALAHPIRAAESLAKGFRAMGSTLIGGNYAKRLEQQIINSPNYKSGVYRRMKLDLSDVAGSNREENMSSVLEKLSDLETSWRDFPNAVKGLFGMNGKQLVKGASGLAKLVPKAIGRTIKASNAGFGAIALNMRARAADAILARNFSRTGQVPTKQFLEFIGDQVNSATGKGGLRGQEGIRAIFYAPNYYLSILKQLTGYPLLKSAAFGNAQATREIATEYVRAVSTMGTILGLAYLFNKDENPELLNPKSSTFGKYTTGAGTQVDLTMGRGAWANLGAQLYTGERINREGEVSDVNHKQALLQFMGNRFSPEITRSIMLASGKDYFGNELTTEGALRETLVPLSWKDFDKIIEKEGYTRGSFLQLLNFLGITVRPLDDE